MRTEPFLLNQLRPLGKGGAALTQAAASIALSQGQPQTIVDVLHGRAFRYYAEGLRQYLAIRTGSTERVLVREGLVPDVDPRRLAVGVELHALLDDRGEQVILRVGPGECGVVREVGRDLLQRLDLLDDVPDALVQYGLEVGVPVGKSISWRTRLPCRFVGGSGGWNRSNAAFSNPRADR